MIAYTMLGYSPSASGLRVVALVRHVARAPGPAASALLWAHGEILLRHLLRMSVEEAAPVRDSEPSFGYGDRPSASPPCSSEEYGGKLVHGEKEVPPCAFERRSTVRRRGLSLRRSNETFETKFSMLFFWGESTMAQSMGRSISGA